VDRTVPRVTLAAQPPGECVEVVPHGARVAEHGPRPVQDQAAGVGEFDASCAPVQQALAELAFQPVDGRGRGRLDDPGPLRSAGEAPFLRHGEEIFEVPKLHRPPVIDDGDAHYAERSLVSRTGCRSR